MFVAHIRLEWHLEGYCTGGRNAIITIIYEKYYLNPIRRAYSPCSYIVNRSVPVQLVLARNRLVLDLKISSIFNGRTAPKISLGLIELCISRTCRNSGDWAHSLAGGLKVRIRFSSSVWSEYSLLIYGSSISSLGTTYFLTGFNLDFDTSCRLRLREHRDISLVRVTINIGRIGRCRWLQNGFQMCFADQYAWRRFLDLLFLQGFIFLQHIL